MASEVVVPHKDVAIALLGASATLAGLILVFTGLVVSAYGAFEGDTPAVVKTPLRRAAGWSIVPFGLGLLQIAAGTIWLLTQWEWLYIVIVALFFAVLLALAVATFRTLKELVWD